MRPHRAGQYTAHAPRPTAARRGIRGLLVAVTAVVALALNSSIALADKGDPLPWTDLGVTLSAPAGVTVGQAFTANVIGHQLRLTHVPAAS